MERAGAVFLESGHVLRNAVAFMLIKAVIGINLVVVAHQAVARLFGNHRGRRNHVDLGVAADDLLAGNAAVVDRHPIDEEVVGKALEGVESSPHRQERRLIDVDCVDLFSFGLTHTVEDIGVGGQSCKKALTLEWRELLAVIDPLKEKTRRNHAGRRNNGAC